MTTIHHPSPDSHPGHAVRVDPTENRTGPAVAEKARTPTPWHSTRRTFNYGCYGHEIACLPHVANLSTVQAPMEIAYIPTDTDRDRANAAFIVRAVNHHEALVSFVDRIARFTRYGTGPDELSRDQDDAEDTLNSLIAIAQKTLTSIGS